MKSILAVQHADGAREGICKCGQKMVWRPGGTDRYIQAGNLVEDDFVGYWTCQCGYHSDEEEKWK